MPWEQYRSVSKLPVIGGVRGLVRERCGETGQLYPDEKKGRRCPGWQFRWVPQRMNYLDDLVVRAAYGRRAPYDHRIRRNSTQWLWVRTSDAAQLSARRARALLSDLSVELGGGQVGSGS
jgi:hypothetical protein